MSLRSKWAAGKARGGRISKSIRNRRATQPPAHFQRNPPGRGQLAVFPRCSLLTYRFRYARRSRLEKQPTDLRRKTCYFGDRTLVVIYWFCSLADPSANQRLWCRWPCVRDTRPAADFLLRVLAAQTGKASENCLFTKTAALTAVVRIAEKQSARRQSGLLWGRTHEQCSRYSLSL